MEKIRFLNNKKIMIYFSLLLIASLCVLVPATIGYGDDFATAEEITNGTYSKTLLSGDDEAYYKISCSPGDYITVTLTVDYPTYDLDIILYNKFHNTEDSSYNAGDVDEVFDTVDERGYYYIRVSRYEPDYGNVPFQLVITGATGTGGIPGFEMISLLIVIISTISLIYLRVKRKK